MCIRDRVSEEHKEEPFGVTVAPDESDDESLADVELVVTEEPWRPNVRGSSPRDNPALEKMRNNLKKFTDLMKITRPASSQSTDAQSPNTKHMLSQTYASEDPGEPPPATAPVTEAPNSAPLPHRKIAKGDPDEFLLYDDGHDC